jgi:CheY-like chemotaxis protein
VAALEAGGVDYVTKPIKPKEVLARMGVHLQSARQARQTRNALDAFGYASIAVRASDGRLMWQTPLARDLLLAYYGTSAPETPAPILDWLRRHLRKPSADRAAAPVGRTRRASACHSACTSRPATTTG